MNCSTFALITIGISNSCFGFGRSFGRTSMLKSSLASSLIGKSKLDASWFPAGDRVWGAEGSSGEGGNSREGEFSGSVWARGKASSFVEGGGGGGFSEREPEWGRHAETRNKIIPTANVLCATNHSSRVCKKMREIRREKIYRLMT